MTEIEKKRAIIAICEAVVDAVKAAGPLGAPGGTIYAAMMAFGMDIHQYNQVMGALVQAGNLRKQGDLYFARA